MCYTEWVVVTVIPMAEQQLRHSCLLLHTDTSDQTMRMEKTVPGITQQCCISGIETFISGRESQEH